MSMEFIPFERTNLDFGIVYRYINLVNNKMYHGQTTQDLKKRQIGHKDGSRNFRKGCNYFYKAVRKYGLDNFKIEILCKCGDVLSLGLMEDLCINLFSLSPKGYNLRRGGIHGKLSEETIKRMSITNKRVFSEGTRKKIGDANRKRLYTEETKNKIRESLLKHWNDLETRQKHSEIMQEYFKNPEVREKMSNALKNSNKHKKSMNSDEIKKFRSEFMREFFKETDNRLKLSESIKNSESHKQAMQNTEVRKKMSDIKKELYKNRENREKMSLACKKSKKVQDKIELQKSVNYRENMSNKIKNSEKHKISMSSKEVREKIRKSVQERLKKREICPYCKQEFSGLGLPSHLRKHKNEQIKVNYL